MNTAKVLSRSSLKALASIFPGDALSLRPEEMLIYGTDAGKKFSMPWAVVRPERTEQVQELMALAQKERIPVIPRARGTNVVSACVPDQGGVVLSCLRMNKVLSIDPRSFTACVQPGVITHDLQKKVRSLGLYYPPDPASMKVSTIGGNIATNAGGMSAVKYGVTRDYVLGLEAVLPGGEIIRTGGRVHKNVVGLDLTRLFTGSEGGLGIIVKAWLKLLPAPEYSASILACFEDEVMALEGVSRIFESGILPCAMEFLPGEIMKCLAGYGPVPWPEDAGACLIIRVDGSVDGTRHQTERIRQSLQNTLYLDVAGQEDEERIWEMRRLINPASFSLGPDKVSDDVVVPRGVVLDAVQGIRAIARKYALNILAFGHIGDGNIHVNYMHDASQPGSGQRVDQARQEVLSLVLELEGSISGEHGVGLSKKPFLTRQVGPRELEIMRSIKKVFDPYNILNPGKGI
ncbi:FAD-binding oxidoreductase [Desulfonatronovibrio hydrogenovorans]|uniref:FAD-binding oxidoreductase n=1 Tax=Desulfonatronovibrio hydrogenovorans TaxID=53245 RepID=UPI0004912EAA|nr:FAD-linked oxidase C-terminal domain-containing protein [Desulfonatronovibrio hydrogenovorans]